VSVTLKSGSVRMAYVTVTFISFIVSMTVWESTPSVSTPSTTSPLPANFLLISSR
jgi:hypothetical protein